MKEKKITNGEPKSILKENADIANETLDENFKKMIMCKLDKSNKTKQYKKCLNNFLITMKEEEFDKKEFEFSRKQVCHKKVVLNSTKSETFFKMGEKNIIEIQNNYCQMEQSEQDQKKERK